jgi:hypothetical protein
MARVQVESSVRAEALQSFAAPLVQGVQARFDPRADKSLQLVEQLSKIAPESNKILGTIEKMQERTGAEYASSITVDDLNKQIKDGTLSAAHSPVAVAAIHNVHGQNLASRITNETQRKIETGELTFNSNEELDKYLLEQRSSAIQSSSKYSAAGFDKQFAPAKNQLFNINSKYQAKRFESEGAAQVYESLSNLQQKFANNPGLNAEQRAEETKGIFKFFKDTGLLANPAKAREVWAAHIDSVANRGDINAVDALLAMKLDNGLSVRSMIAAESPAAIQSIENKVQAKYQKIIVANQVEAVDVNAEAAIKNGAGAQLKDITYFLPDGTSKTISADDQKKSGFARATANLPLDITNEDNFSTRVRMAAVSNVVDPELKSELKAAISNIDSANWSANDKKVGDLSMQGMRSIEMFRRVNTIAPNYTSTLLSNEEYSTLDTISTILSGAGGGDYTRSAQMVSAANKNKRDDPINSKKMRDDVESKLNSYLDPSWIFNPIETFKGIVTDNSIAGMDNSNVVVTKAKKLAEIYYLSRQYNTTEEAAQAATEYIKNSTIKVNNFTYDLSELPQVPPGYSHASVMEKYIKDKVMPISDSQKLGFKSDEFQLKPGVPGVYTVTAGGMPLTDKDNKLVYVTNQQIEEWAKTAQISDIKKANSDSEYTAFKDRLAKESASLKKKDPFVISTYDSTYNGFHWNREIYSPEAFAKLKAEGLDKKPLSELLRTMKERRGQQ